MWRKGNAHQGFVNWQLTASNIAEDSLAEMEYLIVLTTDLEYLPGERAAGLLAEFPKQPGC